MKMLLLILSICISTSLFAQTAMPSKVLVCNLKSEANPAEYKVKVNLQDSEVLNGSEIYYPLESTSYLKGIDKEKVVTIGEASIRVYSSSDKHVSFIYKFKPFYGEATEIDVTLIDNINEVLNGNTFSIEQGEKYYSCYLSSN